MICVWKNRKMGSLPTLVLVWVRLPTMHACITAVHFLDLASKFQTASSHSVESLLPPEIATKDNCVRHELYTQGMQSQFRTRI